MLFTNSRLDFLVFEPGASFRSSVLSYPPLNSCCRQLFFFYTAENPFHRIELGVELAVEEAKAAML